MLKPYRPSSGTEGDIFTSKFCDHCIHEKFTHTQNHRDKQCDILSGSMIFDLPDAEYPKELVYDKDERPTCLNYKHFDWGNIRDGINEPPDDPDPNQLALDLFS